MAAILGSVASCVGPVIEIGKHIVVREFSYLCRFNSHIQSLRHEAGKLKIAREGLQVQVDVAKGKAEVILEGVQDWLKDANEIQDDMREIENEIRNVESSGLNIKSRYLLSKKAEKTTDAIKKLQDRKKFDIISRPASTAATTVIPVRRIYEFESRKHIEKEIMEALESNKVNIIGICGMGGIGKTTMAQRIRNRVIETHLFDEAVITVVGQEVDRLKVLHEISDPLELPEAKTLASGAHQLHNRLKGEKKILIVVDDIWKAFQLEDLGISCQDGVERHHKVLLTSRDKGVLNAMGAQKVCEIETLDERDARLLFTEKSGICSNDFNLLPIAENILKECSGLPIALTTVGSALKGQKNKDVWECFLQQLKDANPDDVPGVIDRVYKPLKASYDLLDSQNARSLFLLCSLFPEDSKISLEDLTLYCMGLRIFGRTRNLKEARNTVVTVIEQLKARCLLLDGSSKYYYVENHHHPVRMHDVVRDVAIYIASKERLAYVNPHSREDDSYSKCKWISFFLEKGSELLRYTLRLNIPSLRMLMMHHLIMSYLEIEDFSFLEGMKELNVLSFKYISFKSVPQSMQLLKNLRTLHLENCALETLSVVGELLSLEILCCRSCRSIKELPIQIGRLNRLKFLEFSNCIFLQKIPPGVLSNLIELEELTIVSSFCEGELAEAKEKQRTNVIVSLHELQSLLNLTCLNIEIEDCTTGERRFFPKIVKYHMELDTSRSMSIERPFEKNMHPNLPIERSIGGLRLPQMGNHAELRLSGDGSNIWDLLQAPNVKSLRLTNCLTVKKLMDTTSIDWWRSDVLHRSDLPNSFEYLKELNLVNLPALEHLWNNPNQNASLSNLSSITVRKCDRLCSLAIAVDSLLQLQDLRIDSCSMMKEVFLSKSDGKKSHIRFPKLKEMALSNLESLTTFCQEIESIEFPMLTEIDIRNCPRITSLVSSIEKNQNWASTHLFCSQQVSNFFKNLERLYLDKLPALKHLWNNPNQIVSLSNLSSITIRNCGLGSLAIAMDSLPRLQDLQISSCSMMEHVFSSKSDGKKSHITFRQLKNLALSNLENLTTFCQEVGSIEFPMLTRIQISNCPRITSLVSSIENNQNSASTHLFCSREESNSFKNLEKLILMDLPALKHLWNNPNEIVSLSNLSYLSIWNCGLGSLAIAMDSLPRLQDLWIDSCSMMEHVFSSKSDGKKGRITFPQLKRLGLSNLENLTTFCQEVGSIEFPMLTEIEISNCPRITSLVSSIENNQNSASTHLFCSQEVSLDIFPVLKSLKLSGLPNLEEMCDCPIPVVSNFFKNIKEIKIEKLPKLKHLRKSSQQNKEKEKHGEITTKKKKSIEFPALTDIQIIDCPELISLLSSSMGIHQNLPNSQDDDSIHLFCKVTIGSLEELKIGGYNNISKIWCHQIPDNFFTRLTYLRIVECNSIRSLFSTTIARNLVNLKTLVIEGCKEMVKVIEDDEETNRQTSCPLLLFPSLFMLALDSLPKLGSFCEWRCIIELPKLWQLTIDGCRMMKVFTMGSLISTPNLGNVFFEDQYKGKGDLNELLKLHCYTEGGDTGRAEIVE